MSNLGTKLSNPIIKLDLGCGIRNRKQPAEEWIHIDIQDIEGIIVADFTKLEMFADCSVDEINAADVIEHIKSRELQGVLKEWCRVLKVEGKIHIQTPNLHSTMIRYAKGDLSLSDAVGALYGSQESDWQQHYQTFTTGMLENELDFAGFTKIDFSGSPGSDRPEDSWWIVCTANKK